MHWKEFFKPTKKKILTFALLFIMGITLVFVSLVISLYSYRSYNLSTFGQIFIKAISFIANSLFLPYQFISLKMMEYSWSFYPFVDGAYQIIQPAPKEVGVVRTIGSFLALLIEIIFLYTLSCFLSLIKFRTKR